MPVDQDKNDKTEEKKKKKKKGGDIFSIFGLTKRIKSRKKKQQEQIDAIFNQGRKK